MDIHDEIRAAMQVYAARGLPEMPDRALLPHRPNGLGAWFERLTPRDQQRIRQAVDQGARNGPYVGAWTENA